MRIRSFKYRLIFSYLFIISVSFGLIAFFLDKHFERDSLRFIKQSLVDQAGLIESQLPAKILKEDNLVDLENLVKGLSARIKSRVTIIDKQGKVLADSEESPPDILKMENHVNRPEIKLALQGAVGEEMRYSNTLKINMLYVALPIKENGEIGGVVRLALPLVNVRENLWAIRKAIFFSVIFALALAFALGSVLAGTMVKSINKIIRVSRKFASGDFSHKIYLEPRDEIGELAATLNKMAQDIEDKIREVKTQNQKLSAIFNCMIEGVIVVDKAGRIVSVNPTIEKIFGVTKKDTEGRVFLEAIRNNDIPEVINAALQEERAVSKEIALIYPVRRTFEVNATPIFDNNTISGCLVVIHDITEIRRLETMRSDFVANVSHELKTPLTSIKGFVETLLEGALDDKENNRNFLQIIREHAERLNSLVNDLLSLSHLESREIILEKNNFNLRQLLEEVISGFRSQLKKKNIEINNELPAGLLIRADKERIEQVFTNLIDNAIKFNQENGSIKIYDQIENDRIKIIVEDSGVGIPERDIPRIFERFYRVDKARSRNLGGTGLGLSIVKHIVELHGGMVGVESAEGFGSRFWFILPK